MAKSKEFESLLDAAEDILAGKPVDDLDERKLGVYRHLDEFGNGDIAIADSLGFLTILDYERRILQGENPAELYGAQDHDYKAVRDQARKFLQDIIDKHR